MNSNIKLVKFDGSFPLPQTVKFDMSIIQSYTQIKNISADFLLILDKGWDFTHENCIMQIINDMNSNEYCVGIYSDSIVNGVYKNNLPFSHNTLLRENILTGLLIKKDSLPENMEEISSVQELIKLVGQNYMLYRSPNILFKYEV